MYNNPPYRICICIYTYTCRHWTDLTPPSVVIATGLMALVDDCIKRRFHQKQSTQLHIPLLKNKLHLDYIGPKRLIDEMFNRTARSGSTGRQTSALRRPATQA